MNEHPQVQPTAPVPESPPEDLLSDVLVMMHTHGLIHVLLLDADRRPTGADARPIVLVSDAAGNPGRSVAAALANGVPTRLTSCLSDPLVAA